MLDQFLMITATYDYVCAIAKLLHDCLSLQKISIAKKFFFTQRPTILAV